MATIKELRKFMGLTQQSLADKAGLNIRAVQRYEGGECSLENMTAKYKSAFEKAFDCPLENIYDLNLSAFTEEASKAVKSGDMTLEDLLRMDKYNKVQKISKIGAFDNTFRANFSRIPDSLFKKLTAEEIAELTDAFYQCYSDGKNASN